MKQDDLNSLKAWFADYCASFYTSDIEDRKNILLKERHTFDVCRNIAEIAKGLLLDENSMLLAETVALFHDIGRFPQYAEYKTFRDGISVNHGMLGSRVLVEKDVLKVLSSKEQEVVIKSVKFHNAFSVPRNEKEEVVFFTRLVRDADKLDIWRVFLEYFDSPAEERASAVGLGLPDSPGYSEEVLATLYERRIVTLSSLKTLNDFKLLQLSWIFDLNFRSSFELLFERRYIDRMLSHLPETDAIRELSVFLKEFVYAKVSG
jgi:hypothetical protein